MYQRFLAVPAHVFCLGAFGVLVSGRLSVQAQAQAPPAQPATAAAVKPAKPMTLLQGLTQITPLPSGVTLTVGPQWEDLPKESLAPAPTATVADVASSFGKANQTFGGVVAVGPPTMVLLNASPGEPDPYDGMPYYDVVPLFAATLTDGQWASLTSEQGLGIGELLDTQRRLFDQLLPKGRLRVAPWFGDFNPTPDAEKDLTDQLLASRLRLKRTAEVQISTEGDEHGIYQMQHNPPASGGTYKLLPARLNYGGSQEVVYGQRVRAEVPNQLKAGQLAMDQSALKTAVPVGGLKTVGDLMARVAQAAHLELYADRRLEQKTLLILGAGKTAPAADLLKATAFCLTGVYRRVGPAFVLTDDETGIATRMARWQEFEALAEARRRKPLDEARASLSQRFGTRKIPSFGDPLAATGTQDTSQDTEGLLSTLPAAQQEAVRDTAALFEKSHENSIQAGVMKPLDLNGPIRLFPAVTLQLIAPSLTAPVDMGVQLGRSGLFAPPPLPVPNSEDNHAAAEKQMRAFLTTHQGELVKEISAHPEMWPGFAKQFPDLAAEILAAHPALAALVNRPLPSAPPLPPLASILRRVPNRAALISPTRAEDADADVAAAQARGLTQLWVSVFAGGQTDTTGLAEVLKRTQAKTAKKTPLQIFAVLDVFSWGAKPPPIAQDLTVLGDNSSDALARHQEMVALQGKNAGDTEQDTETTPGVAVSPLAPAVQDTLVSLVRSLAAMPGLAGVVLRQTAPPGYDLRAKEENNRTILLGYQGDMRLAFLRSHHADPVDVFSPGRYNGKANTDLPNFQYDGQLSGKVSDEWTAFRREANLYLLNRLRAAARPVRVLVKQRGQAQGGRTADGTVTHPPGWYAAWDAPNAPPPTLYGFRDNRDKQPLAGQDPLAQARAQSPLVLVELPLDPKTGQAPDPAEMAASWRQAAPLGFVLDAGLQRLSQVLASWVKH